MMQIRRIETFMVLTGFNRLTVDPIICSVSPPASIKDNSTIECSGIQQWREKHLLNSGLKP